ncbi:hypothetical protein EB151_11195, partial [archaeon]|nr:hypothetical protein [archaeon]
MGVNNIELGFTGIGKGSSQSPTPGSVGMAERQAIKEVAKINDVNIASVHAPMSIQGLAGYDQRSFNENKRAQDVEEVKRSINFAGDVSNGGAIVVHTGEFPYSIKERFGDTILLAELKGMSKNEAMEELKKYFIKFGIQDWWNKPVEELSKGMQQKAQFIATIVHKPKLVI